MPPEIVTAAVCFYSTNLGNLGVVREWVRSAAEDLDLRVDGLAHSRGVLSKKVTVTVTGSPDQIEAFRERFQGDGVISSGSWGFDDLLGTAVLGFIRRRRRRRGRAQDSRQLQGADSVVSPDAPEGALERVEERPPLSQ